ncbi:MAG TPA: Calx-beta domain-containing protein, partial [Microcoleaceae cyanobacterium]
GGAGLPGGIGGTGGGTGGQGQSSAAAGGGGGAGFGGAIFFNAGSLQIINSSFQTNSATGGTGGNSGFSAPGGNGQGLGGAIYVNAGATFSTSGAIVLTGNTAAQNAGTATNNSNIFGAAIPIVYDFAAATYSAQEGNTTNTTNVVTVNRTGDIRVASSVTVIVGAGSAIAGSDFTATTVTVNFTAGQSTATIPIQLIGDTLNEANETITLSFANPSTGSQIGTSISTATLTIVDDDPAPVEAVIIPPTEVVVVTTKAASIFKTSKRGKQGIKIKVKKQKFRRKKG